MSKTKETSVLLVDPAAKTVVADGYAGIKRIFEARYPAARLEHNKAGPVHMRLG